MILKRGLATGANSTKRVAFVDGARIPFSAAGTTYKNLIGYDLGRLAVKGLVDRHALDTSHVDSLIWGNVIQEVQSNNVARDISLGSGLPQSVSSFTLGQACISSNQAICSGAEKILAGTADCVIAGGAETFSDVPIRVSKGIRQRLVGLRPALKKGPKGVMKLMKGFKLKDMSLELPEIKNFTTGEVMGHSSDRLAARFGVTREAQDEFALRSHHNAASAHEKGYYKGEIVPFKGSFEENCIRGDTTLDKLRSLKPSFIKPHGTHTPGNSSPLTDGAAASLIMSEEKAKSLGLTPKAWISAWKFVSVDAFEEMLLGPAYSIARILKANGLTLNDIDVWEMHEAFAGQVLANLAALDSDSWCKEKLGMDRIGRIPMEKLNSWGSSLSIGHPFGATGSRITTTAANRLHREDGKLAVLAACADGGQGHASVLERA